MSDPSVRRPRHSAPAGIRDPARYSPQLEALRGVAILLVAFFHADGLLGRPSPGLEGTWVSPLAAFVHAGHTGVTLFFVLSGFLLSRPFLATCAGGPRVSYRRFLERRALRILPLYWLAVAAATLLCARAPGDLWRGLPYVVFLNSFGGLRPRLFPYSDVWWSLATEVQFYLALPLVAWSMRSRAGRIAVGVLAGAWLVAYAHTAANGFPRGPTLSIGLFGRAPAFALGVAAAWLHGRHGAALPVALATRGWVRRGGADALLAALLLGLGVLLRWVTYVGFRAAESEHHVWHVAEAALWAGVLLVLLLAPARLARLVDNPALRGVGLISYSLYLVHLPVLFYVIYPWTQARPEAFGGWTLAASGAVAVAMALALGLSALTYAAIERPLLRRKARIGA